MRPALLALALLLAACGGTTTTVDIPDETTTSVDLGGPAPLPTVPTTVASTLPPPTAPPSTATPVTTRATLAPQTSPPTTEVAGTYYANCNDVRAAGAAPLRRGEPGYRPGLDRDGDGTACDREG